MGVSSAATIDEDNDNNNVSIDGGGIEGRPRAERRRDVVKRPAWATSVEQRMDADTLRDDMELVISIY